MADNSKATKRDFKALEYIVYPAHGVGQIEAIEKQEVAGQKLELFVIRFERDRMHVKVPVNKAIALGMRKLVTHDTAEIALKTLYGKVKAKRAMWSRRAQEYEAKINSGDIFALAEAVRDLFKSPSQATQSYSERQLYEVAIDRFSREIALVRKISLEASIQEIEKQLEDSVERKLKSSATVAVRQDKNNVVVAA
ncbi:CarD family transcriptional regulator [Bartonella sp. TP]|uniref:CarD family transcriptional regulator n=1 Tax=Bartonella sp. TP TaxID=3057550 RepID=UPI0025AEF744|nr:CarD family transcriptional regulator [Bartonella sp. TP]MDN5248498.1 CarD family transcriptional regulator [Alphaproteobacteria bacterium]WJW79577.1 CarD family transcriptional regulator [Bartonella sp. TP]